jgi:predicted MPP superfamily phosphohydrolase
MEAMGFRVLLNESIPVRKNASAIYMAGIDDAHYFRMEDFNKTVSEIPQNALSILLSHTPEVYAQAAEHGFAVMFCGHTHGGQICLPGGIPITLDSRCPRNLGRGSWQHNQMQGYTSAGSGCSIVVARINCPPEVTLHTLVCAA